MFPIARLKPDRPTLVESPKANPVFKIDSLEVHRYNNSVRDSTAGVKGRLRVVTSWLEVLRNFRPKPGGFLRNDCLVFGKDHENQLPESGEIEGVRPVPSFWKFIVDRREELVHLKVSLIVRWVPEVLCLT